MDLLTDIPWWVWAIVPGILLVIMTVATVDDLLYERAYQRALREARSNVAERAMLERLHAAGWKNR